jgi:hypothetical protein
MLFLSALSFLFSPTSSYFLRYEVAVSATLKATVKRSTLWLPNPGGAETILVSHELVSCWHGICVLFACVLVLAGMLALVTESQPVLLGKISSMVLIRPDPLMSPLQYILGIFLFFPSNSGCIYLECTYCTALGRSQWFPMILTDSTLMYPSYHSTQD